MALIPRAESPSTSLVNSCCASTALRWLLLGKLMLDTDATHTARISRACDTSASVGPASGAPASGVPASTTAASGVPASAASLLDAEVPPDDEDDDDDED